MKEYYVASFSGGKDSTAMLLRLLELGEQVDEVIFCDTYKEFPAMYRHVERVRKVVEDAGIKFTELKAEKDFDYYMFEHLPKRKNKALEGLNGFSWPGPKSRWCSGRLKIQIIEPYLKKLGKDFEVYQYIGLAADETKRLERENNKNPTHIHPLVNWGWTEQDCLNYCYALGYDWEGLYNHFTRVSCWCCPLQSLEELRKLRIHYPELWAELLDMDKRTWRKFRADYSVEELDKRFAFEEKWLAEGNKSIRSRDFFKALKEVLANGNNN